MNLTKEQLFNDIHVAFIDAKKHKSNKGYVKFFECNLKTNLETLCDELWNRIYTPGRSTCFMVHHPNEREVFAAEFRDRIVHHLYFNYTHKFFERTFIKDTYSCIKNRGTHFGIHRLEKHIRQESQNYTKPCYILKVDIKGYFINISRQKLYDITINSLEKLRNHLIHKGQSQTWDNIIDYEFVKYLTKIIIFVDPIINCKILSRSDEWEKLKPHKSMFCVKSGYGLPVGNLTSQLFSNIYLNLLDHYCKRVLHSKHYGRYVDDSYHVSCNKEFLKSLIQPIKEFLKNNLELDVNLDKTKIYDIYQGVEFLGAYIKPYRTYINNGAVKRMLKMLPNVYKKDKYSIYSSINSYLGLLSHYKSYKLRFKLFVNNTLNNIGYFSSDLTSFKLYNYDI